MSETAIDPRAALAERIFNDPKHGPRFKEIIKDAFPAAQIPDVDAKRAVQPEIDALRKEVVTLRDERTKEQQTRSLREAREGIMNDPALRIGAEELPHVEKLMTDELVGNHRTAAELWRGRQRTAAPGPVYDFTGMQMPGVNGAGGDRFAADTKTGRPGILHDRRGWTRHEINAALNESAQQSAQGLPLLAR